MNKASKALSIAIALPIMLGGAALLAVPAQAAIVCYTAPNGAQDCYDNGQGSGIGGSNSGSVGGSVGNGGGNYIAPPAPAPPAPAPAPVYQAPAPVYQAPAPAPVYQAPAPVYQAPAPVYQAPAPAPNNVPAAPSGSAPVQNATGAWVDPANGVAVAAATATAATEAAPAPIATPDDAKIAADKAAAEKVAADKEIAAKASSDTAVQDSPVQAGLDTATSNQAVQVEASRASQTSPTGLPVLFLSGGLALAYILTYGIRSYRIRKTTAGSFPEADSELR